MFGRREPSEEEIAHRAYELYRKACFCLSIFIFYFIPSFLTHLRLWCWRLLNQESHQPFDVLRGGRY